jgi:hypothetical protein
MDRPFGPRHGAGGFGLGRIEQAAISNQQVKI